MSVKQEIINGAARTAFSSAWADYQEEIGADTRGWAGRDIGDFAPATPAKAKAWARKIITAMEKMNGSKIDKMYAQAIAMEGRHTPGHSTPEHFGSDTAMEAMGHGVSWSDDHPDHGFKLPRAEAHYFGRSFVGNVSER